MLNKVMIIGNLGRDPEVRTIPSGTAVAEFSVATTRKWNDRDGNRKEDTEWHNVKCWGKQAEIAGQYLHKGKQVYVEGRLETRSWEDKTHGDKRYRTEIICDNFQMLGRRGDSSNEGGQGGGGGGGGQSQDSGGQGGGGGGASFDDDIPF